MIIGGVELISHRHHGGLWNMAAQTITGRRPSALPPHTLPQSATQQTPSTQRHGSRAEIDLATKVTLGLWALYIPNLVVSTGLRVLAWGTGTANTEEGSVPGRSPDAIGYDESGYHIGAGHPDYHTVDW